MEKKVEKFRISEPLRGQSLAALDIFFTVFKKDIRKSNHPIKSSYLSRNDIVNLVSSKVTHVCNIMTCFANFAVINLYITSRHIF